MIADVDILMQGSCSLAGCRNLSLLHAAADASARAQNVLWRAVSLVSAHVWGTDSSTVLSTAVYVTALSTAVPLVIIMFGIRQLVTCGDHVTKNNQESAQRMSLTGEHHLIVCCLLACYRTGASCVGCLHHGNFLRGRVRLTVVLSCWTACLHGQPTRITRKTAALFLVKLCFEVCCCFYLEFQDPSSFIYTACIGWWHACCTDSLLVYP
jgi:hypothetical protein